MNRPVLEGREDPGIGRIKVKEGKCHRDRGHDPTHDPLRIDLSEESFVVDDSFFIYMYGFLIFSHLAESPYLR